MKKIFVSALLLFAAAGAPVLAGVVFEIETTDHDASPPRVESGEMAVQGRDIKYQLTEHDGRRSEMVFRGARREWVVVDHRDKSYMVVDPEAIGSVVDQVSDAMKAFEDQIGKLPEDQQNAFREMMKGRIPGAAEAPRVERELRKTGERDTKNGYPCVKYEVLHDGVKVRELWVTPAGEIEGGDEALSALREMAESFEQTFAGIRESLGGLGGQVDLEMPFSEMRELDGFPVVVRNFEDGELENEASLRSASRRTLDPADFEPPAGYKRRSMGPN